MSRHVVSVSFALYIIGLIPHLKLQVFCNLLNLCIKYLHEIELTCMPVIYIYEYVSVWVF